MAPRGGRRARHLGLSRPALPGRLAAAVVGALLAGRAAAEDLASVPFSFAKGSDLFNQEAAIKYFEGKYYNAENRWSLAERHLEEAGQLVGAAAREPVLALAAAQVLYLFGWFRRDGEIIRENVVHSARLFEGSIAVGGCDAGMTVEEWLEGACDIRFGQACLLYAWLGETEEDPMSGQGYKDRAMELFGYLKTVPRFREAAKTWASPWQMNFNQLRFPNNPTKPIWDSVKLPLAAFLEDNHHVFKAELEAIINDPRDLYETLRKVDGSIESLATPGGWDAVRIVRYGHWFDLFCELAPLSCELLRSRPELVNCPYVNTNFYKLNPGSHLKPHFGNAPRLTVHLPVIAPEPLRAGLTVGHEQALWQEGKALIIDDTYPHSVSHWGKQPRYVLASWFCHPCDEDTDHRQTCPESL